MTSDRILKPSAHLWTAERDPTKRRNYAISETLDGYAEFMASSWMFGAQIGRPDRGRPWLKNELYNLTYKDEFDYVVQGIQDSLGGKARESFGVALDDLLKNHPRDQAVFEKLLADQFAISASGDHIEGRIGKTQVGSRVVAKGWGIIPRFKDFKAAIRDGASEEEARSLIRFEEGWVHEVWPIYAGEAEERERPDGGVADPLPDPEEVVKRLRGGANAPCFSAESAIAALDAIAGRLDEGSTAATIRGRTGAKPADPDATESGTLLFTLTMSDPAFPGAVDDADGTVSDTASAITADSSAAATGTVTYCRFGATGTGADDHIDGEAGTSGSDINFNSTSIVTGANVSMSSAVLHLSQGGTAT